MRLEIQSEEELQQMLALAAPLLGTASSAGAGAGASDDATEESSGATGSGSGLDVGEDIDWDEFGEEQCLLARSFWLCRAPSGDTQYLVRSDAVAYSTVFAIYEPKPKSAILYLRARVEF